MKSKLTMLILAGGLAFSAGVPSAMAKSNGVGPISHAPVAVSNSAAKAAAKKAAMRTAKTIPCRAQGKCSVTPPNANN